MPCLHKLYFKNFNTVECQVFVDQICDILFQNKDHSDLDDG